MGDEALILTAVAAGAAAVSTVFVGLQARHMAQQTKVSNEVANLQAMRELSRSLQAINLTFVDKPHLRPFFYDSKPVPRRPKTRHQVESIAEAVGDVLEDSLYTAESNPGFAAENQSDLLDYALFLRAHSPVFAKVMCEHGNWWPRLDAALAEAQPMTR